MNSEETERVIALLPPTTASGLVVIALREAQAEIKRLTRDQCKHRHLDSSIPDPEITIRDQEIARLQHREKAVLELLNKINSLQWSPVDDGAGPSDCTPNEKGMLGWIGTVSSMIKEFTESIKEVV